MLSTQTKTQDQLNFETAQHVNPTQNRTYAERLRFHQRGLRSLKEVRDNWQDALNALIGGADEESLSEPESNWETFYIVYPLSEIRTWQAKLAKKAAMSPDQTDIPQLSYFHDGTKSPQALISEYIARVCAGDFRQYPKNSLLKFKLENPESKRVTRFHLENDFYEPEPEPEPEPIPENPFAISVTPEEILAEDIRRITEKIVYTQQLVAKYEHFAKGAAS